MLNKMFTIVVIMSFGSFLLSGEVTKSSDKEKSKTEKVKTKKELKTDKEKSKTEKIQNKKELKTQKQIDKKKERPNKVKPEKVDSDKKQQIKILKIRYGFSL